MGMAISLYVDEADGKLPQNGGPKVGGTYRAWSWDDYLSGYDGRRNLDDLQKDEQWLRTGADSAEMYQCPEDDTERSKETMTARSYIPNWIRNNVGLLAGAKGSGADLVGRGILTVPYNPDEVSESLNYAQLPSPSTSIGWFEYHSDHNSMGLFENNQGAMDALGLLGMWGKDPFVQPSVHGEYQSNFLMLDMSVKTFWFPDTLEVVRQGTRGETTRTSTTSPWVVRGNLSESSVVGTHWDCW
jgi:hypothetical protein